MLPPNISGAMATPSSLFSAYASFTASMMLARTMLNDIVPRPIQTYVWHAICSLFVSKSPDKQELTLVVEEYAEDIGKNQIYSAAEHYLSSMIGTDTDRLKISKSPSKARVLVRLARDETLRDTFDGINIMWKFVSVNNERTLKKAHSNDRDHVIQETKRYFELSFDKKYKDKIIGSYVPYVIDKSIDLMGKERVLKMFTLGVYGPGRSMSSNGKWSSINLDHPSTFDTLAMDPGLKKTVMDDLDRFLGRREFYKRVGRAWKRGYLLYGPPGTGKSSLVAAMANYLKFDVYDLQLSNIRSDSQLRELLLDTGNSSILVIEDIDCSIDLPDRSTPSSGGKPLPDFISPRYELTLSGLLNFIDGLWSSCGDERIIVFTTNHIEKLDPALLRPGRMDMKIHMSYCTYCGFELLASNYLGVTNGDRYLNMLSEVESLISESNVTPAEVADEFMKSEDPGVALDGLVKLLKRKRMDATIGNSEVVVEDSFEDHLSKKKKFEEYIEI